MPRLSNSTKLFGGTKPTILTPWYYTAGLILSDYHRTILIMLMIGIINNYKSINMPS